MFTDPSETIYTYLAGDGPDEPNDDKVDGLLDDADDTGGIDDEAAEEQSEEHDDIGSDPKPALERNL